MEKVNVGIQIESFFWRKTLKYNFTIYQSCNLDWVKKHGRRHRISKATHSHYQREMCVDKIERRRGKEFFLVFLWEFLKHCNDDGKKRVVFNYCVYRRSSGIQMYREKKKTFLIDWCTLFSAFMSGLPFQ